MANVNYSFSTSTSAFSGYNPLVVTFTPQSISLSGSQFLAKLVYDLPDGPVTKINTFLSYNEALDSKYSSIDCRVPWNYTVPGETTSTYTIKISAYIGPDSFNPTVYTLSATVLLPKFTRNPLASASPYAFGEVHLLKTRAWGVQNEQYFLLETKDPNYLLVNLNG